MLLLLLLLTMLILQLLLLPLTPLTWSLMVTHLTVWIVVLGGVGSALNCIPICVTYKGIAIWLLW